MRKKFTWLPGIVFIMLCATSQAQIGSSFWKYSNPKSFGFTVNGISFIDENTGLVVGDAGGVARTTDGGGTWQYAAFSFVNAANTVIKPAFNDVQFVTPSLAYAVGNNGLFAKSVDGGFNWTAMNNPLFSRSLLVNALYFFNKDTGFIAGQPIGGTGINLAAKVYTTKDGGLTWDSLATPFTPSITNIALNNNNAKAIERISFANDSVGYISGQTGLLWKYKNGILTDYSLTRDKFGYTTNYAPTSQIYKALTAINDSTVLTASFNNACVIRVQTGVNDSTANPYPLIYGPYSKGKYTLTHYPNDQTLPYVFPTTNISHMKKTAGGRVIFARGNGQLVYTDDKGTTLHLINFIPTSSNAATTLLIGLEITGGGRIIAGGLAGVIADSTTNNPVRFNYTNVKPGGGINKMEFADCSNGATVGGFGHILTTADGGNTWVDKSIPSLAASLTTIYGMSYKDPAKLYFATSNGSIYSSTDQAVTNDLILSDPQTTILNMTTTPSNKIFGVGWRYDQSLEKLVVLRSVNNGASWDTIKAFPTGTLAPLCQAIRFANDDTGYIAGQKGKVFRTTNGGSTWTDVSPFPAINGAIAFADIAIVTGKDIYVVGTGTPKRIYKSTDAGASWTDVSVTLATPAPFLGNLSGILMHDMNNGYVLSNGGTMLSTTDGGATWIPQLSSSGAIFFGAAFTPNTQHLPFANRRAFIAGSTIPNANPIIFEFGDPATVYINSTETVNNASCTNTNGGSVTVNATGAVAPYTYSINGGAFQSANIFSGLAQGPQTITIKDAACQQITKTVNVGYTEDLTLTTTPMDTLVCAGAPVQLVANSTATGFSWSPAEGLSDANIRNPVAIVTTDKTYTVTATLNGCVKTGSVNISIKAGPSVSAGPDKLITEGEQVLLQGSGSNNAVSIAWTPAATLTSPGTYTTIAKPLTTTTYTLSVNDTDGCTATDDMTVTVIPYCVKIMNAFTPNGDGLNDRWVVTTGSGCTKQVVVKVFNRYGSEVYRNDNYSNDWDGTYKGKPVPDGTYYYTISYRLIDGRTVPARGDVTILR